MSLNRRTCFRALALMILLIWATACALNTAVAESSTPGESLSPADLVAQTAILIDAQSGRVLFEKDASKRMHPASTTKIMTLLITLESGMDLDQQVTTPPETDDIPAGSSVMPVRAGENLAFRDLLYGLMLPSGNDAANAIAVLVAGSRESFIERMNLRAAEIGCEDTHFANVHGYSNQNHYTTARDLALIAREAMKNETFREIVAQTHYTVPPTNLNANERRLVTSTIMRNPNSGFYYEHLIGIKTGRHSKAGECFVGAAAKDGVELISVALKSTESGRWIDTQSMMDYGFSLYHEHSFMEMYEQIKTPVTVENAHPEDPEAGALTPDVLFNDSYSIRCLDEEYPTALEDFKRSLTTTFTEPLTAPITKGDAIGSVTLHTPQGQSLTTTLLANRDVAEAPPAPEPWLDTALLIAAIVLLLILSFVVIMRIRRAVRRKNRKNRRMRR